LLVVAIQLSPERSRSRAAAFIAARITISVSAGYRDGTG
jgi:hypothetical protein